MGLSFHVEWLDAPGVADVVDAALWARLEMVAEGVDGTAVPLTELRDARTGQVRSGVYGSLYPLARWVVDAYWNLLWEIRRTPRLQSGRNAARIEALRPWVQRHCLLAAREGFSLPDLTLARDGEHVVLALFPDPPAGSVSARRPVSFIGRATLRLRREAVEEALRTFVDAVLERLRGVEHPDAQRLRDDWSAIFDADEAEARLCAWAARLGIDPYDEEQLDERLVEFIEDHLVGLPAGLRTDLLDAASGATELEQAVSWLARHDSVLHGLPEPGPIGPREAAGSAHQVGYARARRLRRFPSPWKRSWVPTVQRSPSWSAASFPTPRAPSVGLAPCTCGDSGCSGRGPGCSPAPTNAFSAKGAPSPRNSSPPPPR